MRFLLLALLLVVGLTTSASAGDFFTPRIVGYRSGVSMGQSSVLWIGLF